MTKEIFKDTLSYGKCECGNIGTDHMCEAGSVGNPYRCNCCLSCQRQCRDMNEKLEYMASIVREEIDKEITDELREIYKNL